MFQTGDLKCPGGAYSVKHLYYASVSDTRDCATCTCGSLTGATCSASVHQYSSKDGTCSSGSVSYGQPIACDAINLPPADFMLTIDSTPGSCAPSQGVATGGASPASATTFCCLP
jgi:hypothetical protein